ncbi:MAG: hypothetical protein U0R24_11695 [Solirubrobacterales bacterium]
MLAHGLHARDSPQDDLADQVAVAVDGLRHADVLAGATLPATPRHELRPHPSLRTEVRADAAVVTEHREALVRVQV